MSTPVQNPRFDHVIEALRRLSNNPAAAALIQAFEEQRDAQSGHAVLPTRVGNDIDAASAAAVDASAVTAPSEPWVVLPAPDNAPGEMDADQTCAEPSAQPLQHAGAATGASESDGDNTMHQIAVETPNPIDIQLDTTKVDQADLEKPAATVPQDSAIVDSLRAAFALVASEQATALPTSPVADMAKDDVASDYVTLAQFVAFLATMSPDAAIEHGGLIRIFDIDFDLASATDDTLNFDQHVARSCLYDVAVGPIGIDTRNFNAVNLSGGRATAGRLYEALAPLVSINPRAGVCIDNKAVLLNGTFTFATDEAVRFHSVTLNPACDASIKKTIRDALVLAAKCIEAGISCGEVLSMLARRIPKQPHIKTLCLVALKDRVVTAKQVVSLFGSYSIVYADIPADLFGEVEPAGDCPAEFKSAPHISMGRLDVTWDQLEKVIDDAVDDDDFQSFEQLPRVAGLRPWALPSRFF